MAHHGDDVNMGNSDLREIFGLGATGNFPEGHLNKDDEGEIKFAIGVNKGKIILNFGKPIAWIGMTKEQAESLGKILIAKSNLI